MIDSLNRVLGRIGNISAIYRRCKSDSRLEDRKYTNRWIKIKSNHKPWEIIYIYPLKDNVSFFYAVIQYLKATKIKRPCTQISQNM